MNGVRWYLIAVYIYLSNRFVLCFPSQARLIRIGGGLGNCALSTVPMHSNPGISWPTRRGLGLQLSCLEEKRSDIHCKPAPFSSICCNLELRLPDPACPRKTDLDEAGIPDHLSHSETGVLFIAIIFLTVINTVKIITKLRPS